MKQLPQGPPPNEVAHHHFFIAWYERPGEIPDSAVEIAMTNALGDRIPVAEYRTATWDAAKCATLYTWSVWVPKH